MINEPDEVPPVDPKPKRHKHVFTALWAHFGPYSDRQKTHHMHDCFTEGCDVLLIGEGYDCKPDAPHKRERP